VNATAHWNTVTDIRLIVNADDFGHSREVNAGILEAHDHGIVTSTSLMVRRRGANEAADATRTRPALAVGLHVELGEWSYGREGWRVDGEVLASGMVEEVRGQVDRFRELVGREPTHLDSHQHVHRGEPARSVLTALAGELRVPLREADPRVRYLGGFYGQTDTGEPWREGVTTDALVSLVRVLPRGTTELGCHPAKGVPPGTSYGVERTLELVALCDSRVREAIVEAGVALISFAELRSPGASAPRPLAG